MKAQKPELITPVSPTLLMGMLWTFVFLVYFLGPINLEPKVSLLGFTFLIAHLLVFSIGATFFARITPFKMSTISYPTDTNRTTNVTCLLMLIGLVGCLMSVYGKLSSLDTISFSTLSSLRTMHAQALLGGQEIKSSFLRAVAFLSYPAGYVAISSALISFEKLTRPIKLLFFFLIFSTALVAICSGGRSQLLVLFLFIFISCYVRGQMGKTVIPRSPALRICILALIAGALLYSSIIWITRTQEAHMNTDTMLQHAASVWGAKPKPYLLSISERLHDKKLTQTVLSSTFYFIQSLSTTEKLLNAINDVPTLMGGYHTDLIAAGLRALPGGQDFLRQGYATLLSANIYGFFTGAWTALFVDFWAFSLFFALIWGTFTGKAWLCFSHQPTLINGLRYIFWSYSILISFISPPFGFSNSFLTFVWFVIFSGLSQISFKYTPVNNPKTNELNHI